MADYIYYYLIVYAVSIVIGLIWLSIHYYWKNEEKKGRELSQLAKEWMMASKPFGFIFFIFPILIIPLSWLFNKIGGFFGIILLIGVPGALIGMIWKKR